MSARDTSRRRPKRVAQTVALTVFVWADTASSQLATKTKPDLADTTTQPSDPIPVTGPARAPNPHWSVPGCRHCHAYVDSEPLPIERGRIDTLCLRCHDGKQARREFHAIGRLFAGSQIVQPEGWPAPGGKLGCITCHDIRHACETEGTRPEENPGFLRGDKAGDLLSFCARCHPPTENHSRFNPHVMLDKDRSPIPRVCSFCHGRHEHAPQQEIAKAAFSEGCWSCHRPEEGDFAVRSGRPKLGVDEPTLCLTCHTRHLDYFEPGHIGMTVPAEIKAYMAAVEKTPAGQGVDADQIARALKTKRQPNRLPLANGERVVCSTCHNPHEEGLFSPDSALGDGAMQHGKPKGRLQFRGLGRNMCRGCHNK